MDNLHRLFCRSVLVILASLHITVKGDANVTLTSNSPVLATNQTAFTCDVTSDGDLVTVKWSHNGTSLVEVAEHNTTSTTVYAPYDSRSEASISIATSNSSAVAELRINSTMTSDAGEYICTVLDSIGNISSASSMLVVREFATAAPLVTVGGESSSESNCSGLIAHSSTVLPYTLSATCTLPGASPDPDVYWSITSLPDVTLVVPATPSASLTLTLTAVAEYTITCDAVHPLGNDSSCFVLDVQDGNDCASDPCQAGGTCVDLIGAYSCTCRPCYGGNNCQNKILNVCTPNPCQNGGTCRDNCDTYTCNCALGWKDSTCNTACQSVKDITNNTSVILGDPVTLTCSALQANASAVYWMHAGLRLTSAAVTYDLTLPSVTLADEGVYECYVRSADGCLTMKSVTINTFYEISPNKSTTEKVTAEEGDDVILDCAATGRPTPYLFWTFVQTKGAGEDSQGVTPSQGNEENVTTATPIPTTQNIVTVAPVAVGGNATANESSLRLDNVEKTEAGTYTCLALIGGVLQKEIKLYELTVTESSGGLKWWAILLIVLAVILLIIIIVVVAFFIYKKAKANTSVEPEDKETRIGGEHTRLANSPYDSSPSRGQSRMEMKDRSSYNNNGYDQHNGDNMRSVDASERRALPEPPGVRGGVLPPLEHGGEVTEKKKKRKKKRKPHAEDEDGHPTASGHSIDNDYNDTYSHYDRD